MVASRLEQGLSDPVSYTCKCEAKSTPNNGKVLLFYRYFGNNPPLPDGPLLSTPRVSDLASWHRELTTRLNITGKIRVAPEGFNIAVAGITPAIDAYIDACITHWSFANLTLSTPAQRHAFFKPSPGCACVFHPATEASVRICSEITPLGITDYVPSSWDTVDELSPAEFHRRCHEESVALMDLRNHYESNIGYFVHPRTGVAALRPQIRRFSQWPQYVRANHEQGFGSGDGEEQILTYCTGGIRCEKATRWMAERDGGGTGASRISTLKGGIAAYLDWADQEIAAGRMTPGESLFKGKNYVFDARGAVGLSSDTSTAPVSRCHVCGTSEDRLSKCRSRGCHLVLVVCLDCEVLDPRCCPDCRERSCVDREEAGVNKGMCACERSRELGLWGAEGLKPPKKDRLTSRRQGRPAYSIPVKIVD